MAKSKKLSAEEEVSSYISTLQHPLKDVVLALRKIILAAGTEVGEQVKWNSLAFYYTGKMKFFDPKEYKRDIVVFNLHRNDFVLLVFPTGATISSSTDLLEGNFPDGRKTARFSTVTEVEDRRNNLQTVIQEWMSLVEK